MANYFYIINGAQAGPLPEQELKDAGVTPSTLVWKEGMGDWTPAMQVEELKPLFQGTTPPPAPAAQPVTPPVTPPATPVAQVTTAPATEQQPPKPDNYLVWSILTTILCCIPFGVVSIVFANQVDTKYMMKDYEGAKKASNQAKTWAIVAASSGLLVAILYTIIVVAASAL